jgi:hypothetical protein
MADSSTGGYQLPSTSDAPHGVPFEDFLQAVIVGLTGLPKSLVRPRWQVTPAHQPEVNVDWASFGITDERDVNLRGSSVTHEPMTETDTVERCVRNRLLISTYGPNAWELNALMSDGLLISQNREAMFNAGVGVVILGPRRNIPELVNNQWLTRVDCEWTIDRIVQRVYGIRNIVSAAGIVYQHPEGADHNLPTPFDTNDVTGT